MSALLDLSRFDDVEVLPGRVDRHEACPREGGGYCEPVPGAPHTASFWTVYGRLREGGVEALIDCDDEHSADVAAAVLRAALALPDLLAALQGSFAGECEILP